jgi:hypothetical protein
MKRLLLISAPAPAPFAACCSSVALTQATQMTPVPSLVPHKVQPGRHLCRRRQSEERAGAGKGLVGGTDLPLPRKRE